MQLFALPEAEPFAKPLAEALGITLAPLEDRAFADGEGKIRPLTSVRGRDAYVVQCLQGNGAGSVHDRLCRLLFVLATLRDHGAARVTAVTPYLCYGRKDRRTKSRDPLTLRYVAQLVEATGCDHIVTLEAHNIMAFQNAFRCRTGHLELAEVFGPIVARNDDATPLCVMSPDPGGIKRAQLFREAIEARTGRATGFAFLDKRRSADVRTAGALSGDIAGARVLIVDDMIATGGTILSAARAARAQGAVDCLAVAAHGLFSEGSAALFAAPELSRIVVSDSVVGPYSSSVELVSAAPAFAARLKRLASA